MTEVATNLMEMTGYDVSKMSAEKLAALNILMSGKVPEKAVKTHPGKSGKMFSYVSHTWVTQQVRRALGPMWSLDVLDHTVHPDGSANATVRLTVYVPLEEGGFLPVTITEVGAFEGNPKMSNAMKVASAVSRGWCRCWMRRGGIGEQFYEKDIALSPEGAWATLKDFGARRKITEERIIARMKEIGVTKKTLVDRFEEAYQAVAELAGTARPVEEVPDELVEAAKKLGAEIIQEEPTTPKPTGWDDESTPFDESKQPTKSPGRQAAQHHFEVLYKWCTDEAGLDSGGARAIWDEVCGKGAWLAHDDETLREIVTAWLAVGTDEEKEALKEHYAC